MKLCMYSLVKLPNCQRYEESRDETKRDDSNCPVVTQLTSVSFQLRMPTVVVLARLFDLLSLS